jgi:translation initiation factor IF-1
MSNAKINVMVGDRVEVELSIYDLNNGRIIRRISGRQVNNNNNNNQKKKK